VGWIGTKFIGHPERRGAASRPPESKDLPHRSPRHRSQRLSRTILSLLVALLFTPPSRAQSPLILTLTLHDTIQPISAQYLHRGLAEAAARHASLVVLSLDTPGGLLDSTRAMVADIENSPVPVAVLIGPTGARASSAGFFLLEAADVAAMLPSTNAGASDPILKEKLENDASAFLRSITVPRHRNTQAAETAVRDSRSFSADECLQLHLIDTVTPSQSALIAALNGRTIQRFDGRSQTLNLAAPTLASIAPSFRERWLTRLTDPNLAVLLLLLGIFLIYAEFNAPGTVIPGALGTLLVMLAFFGLNLLPVRHTAVALVVAGLALLILEFKIPSHFILAVCGIAVLILGLSTLVDAPIAELRVHLATAIATGAGFGIVTFFLGWVALRARRNKVLVGPQAMVGRLALVRTPLAPTGQVEVRGELWQAALSGGGFSPAGASVIVREVAGLQLLVDSVTGAAE
jgi:membrane-bound serine protease (ClpP class)